MSSVLTTTSNHLTISPQLQERVHQGELTQQQVDDFQDFLTQIDYDFLQHPIITENTYTRWFQKGTATDAELRHFIQQFSVFSNQFLVAALLKVINSPTLQQSRASREILLNELGVIYRRLGGKMDAQPSNTSEAQINEAKTNEAKINKAKTNEEKDREGDPEFVSTEGTVDGGICRFRAAHFEWLIAVAEGLGLHYQD
ncbi:MAG: hypothetical protein WCA35_17070, partial [Kovacikia sp.]